MKRLAASFALISLLACSAFAYANNEEKPEWNIELPSGEITEQPINVTEGTWINVDVSPDGQQIAFDLLGDIYIMPISGVAAGASPTNLTSTVAWEMQPRFSPDGKSIAFTSDRTGESKKAGDNIWTMDLDGKNTKQISNETYRLLNGPSWSPDGQYLVARKHFTSRRSLGAGEMWMYHRDAADAKAMGGVQLTKKPTDQKRCERAGFLARWKVPLLLRRCFAGGIV